MKRIALALLATLALALSAAPLAVEAQPAALLLTEWGRVRCPGIRCSTDGRSGLELYWRAPYLWVIRDHHPVLTRTCALLPRRSHAWDCRTGAQGRWTARRVDDLWERLPVSAADEDGD